MAAARSGMMSRFLGYPSRARGIAGGLMLGPSACGEFIRTDLAPRMAAPSSHFFPTSTPALRRASSGEARFVGALFEICRTLVPVADIFATNVSSHFLPEALEGSKVP